MKITLKKYLTNIFSKEKILSIFEYTKNQIIKQAKINLTGTEKKSNVDKTVIEYIKSNFISSNPFVSLLINILIENVPLITQCIYESLKRYVDNLTEV